MSYADRASEEHDQAPYSRRQKVVISDEATTGLVVDLRAHHQSELERPWLSGRYGLVVAGRHHLAMKRAVDLIGAAVLLVVLSPILLAVGLAVAGTSPRPLFYENERIGRAGPRFTFFKFRSMRNGAHEEKSALADRDEADGPIFKIKDDPRLTPIGGFLRKYSLDELPQFWHVLRGHMSLVGPRPPLPEEVEAYGEWERQRLVVTPGITGIWQVSGRSDLDFDTWVAMDIEYIETWSHWLDVKLLCQTVPAVITARGAY